MQTLIEKSQKLTALLIEYREAKIYERCLYHVVPQQNRQSVYFLIEIKTGQIKRDGSANKIRSFLNRRRVNYNTVYKSNLIKPKRRKPEPERFSY